MPDIDDAIASAMGADIPADTTPAETGGFSLAETEVDTAVDTSTVDQADVSTDDEAASTETEQETVEEAVQAALSAPDSWGGFAKTKFNLLPQAIQQELLSYWNAVEPQKKVYDALESVIGDNKQAAVATYGSVEGMFNHYFELDKWAATDPVGLTKWFVQQRGITPEQLFGQQASASAAGQQSADHQQQQPNPLAQKIEELEKRLADRDQVASQQQMIEAEKQITEFSRNPDYPYFKELRGDMAALMQSGKAKNLAEAYEQALWLNPETRKEALGKELEKTTKLKAAQAQKSKQAASIKAGTGHSAPSIANGSNPLDNIINEAMSSRV